MVIVPILTKGYKTNLNNFLFRTFSSSINNTHARHQPLHFTVIGAGIVGLAVARELLSSSSSSSSSSIHHTKPSVTIIESSSSVGLHQTSRNSGVIHAGLYYRPGSLKATLCRAGHQAALNYCTSHKIPVLHVGKLIVALKHEELSALQTVYERAIANNVPDVRYLNNIDQIHQVDSTVSSHALAAIYSPHTAVVDWHAVAKAYAKDVKEMGGQIHFNSSAIALSSTSSSTPSSVVTDRLSLKIKDTSHNHSIRHIITDRIISCAGLYSDRVAHALGGAKHPCIIPVRGEYFTLYPSSSNQQPKKLPSTNIYPVPPLHSTSKAPPFLGIHFTPSNVGDGSVLVGPNAVPAFARNGYNWTTVNMRDIMDMLTYHGFWNLAFQHTSFAIDQTYKSIINPSAAMREAIRYVPHLTPSDFHSPTVNTSGIRAQAVAEDGSLIDDFVFESVYDGKVLHVRNAPSPAATSSLAIARVIVDRIRKVQ